MITDERIDAVAASGSRGSRVCRSIPRYVREFAPTATGERISRAALFAVRRRRSNIRSGQERPRPSARLRPRPSPCEGSLLPDVYTHSRNPIGLRVETSRGLAAVGSAGTRDGGRTDMLGFPILTNPPQFSADVR
jgi:hypothetical protein